MFLAKNLIFSSRITNKNLIKCVSNDYKCVKQTNNQSIIDVKNENKGNFLKLFFNFNKLLIDFNFHNRFVSKLK